jgi:hypothetical protein
VPNTDKRMLAAKKTGIARSEGNQAGRQPGTRRKANASKRGAAKRKAVERPVSNECPSEIQEVFSQPASIPRQSRRKKPWRKRVSPVSATAAAPRRPKTFGESALHSPSAQMTMRIPVRFRPIWL